MINSTISGNSAVMAGGGFFIWYLHTGPLPVLLAFDTIVGNTSSQTEGAIANTGNNVTIRNSIIAGNSSSSGPDITSSGTATIIDASLPMITGGYNIFQNVDESSFADPNNLSQTDMSINSNDLPTIFGSNPYLSDNGGQTKTYELAPGSSNSAIDKIPLQYCHIPEISTASSVQYTDQRSTGRPDNKEQFCDTGAYESTATP